MPLTKEQKSKIVEELKEKFLRKKAVFFVSFTGVDVKTSQDLRRSLKGKEAEYTVVKKTLLERALGEAGIELPLSALTGQTPLEANHRKRGSHPLRVLLTGQVGVAFDYGSQANAVKTLYEFTKKSSFSLLGGILDNSFLDSEKVKMLAQLPSLDAMRQKLFFTLCFPLANFLHALKSVPSNFITVLNQIKAQKAG